MAVQSTSTGIKIKVVDYIEDFPVREMYIGWLSKNNRHQFSVGRMKNLLSFDESETIWQEDA